MPENVILNNKLLTMSGKNGEKITIFPTVKWEHILNKPGVLSTGKPNLEGYYTKEQVNDLIEEKVISAIDENTNALMAKGGIGLQQLQVLSGTTSINESSSELLILPCNFKSYELKTLHFNSSGVLQAKVYEDDTLSKPMVVSIAENEVFDIINIPLIDKLSTSSTGNIYLEFINKTTEPLTVDYELRILNLKSDISN